MRGFGLSSPLMISVGDVQNFAGVSMVYTGSGWTTNAQTQAIDAAARNAMATQLPGGYEAPGVAGPSGFSPLDPAPWPPKDTDRIAGMGLSCIPADWPDPQSGYYAFGLSSIPPRCEDLNAAQASRIPFASGYPGLTNERVMIDNNGLIVGASPLSTPGRVAVPASLQPIDFRALYPNQGAANPILATPPPAAGQTGKSPDLTSTGTVPTDTTRGVLTGTSAIVGGGAGGGGAAGRVLDAGGGFVTPANQQNNAMMYMLVGLVALGVIIVAARG